MERLKIWLFEKGMVKPIFTLGNLVLINKFRIMIKKLIKTIRLLRKHMPELKKELSDLTGVTALVVREIIDIWD